MVVLKVPGDRKQKTVTFRDGPVDVKEFDRESVTDDGSEARYESEDESDDHGGIQVGGFSSHHHADGGRGGMSVLDDSEDGHSNYDQGGAEESYAHGQFHRLAGRRRIFFATDPGHAKDGHVLTSMICTTFMNSSRCPVSIHHRLEDLYLLLQFTRTCHFQCRRLVKKSTSTAFRTGRTHHAERAAAAHAVEPKSSAHAPQPALPRGGASSGEPMLRSANAAEPALQGVAAPQKDSTGPHAHQQGVVHRSIHQHSDRHQGIH